MADNSAVLVELQAATDQFEAALSRVQEQFRQSVGGMDDDARQAGAEIDRAFSALGVRSIENIRYEIATLNQAFATLRQSGTVSAEDIARAEANLQRRVKALNAELANTGPQAQQAGTELKKAFNGAEGPLGSVGQKLAALQRATLAYFGITSAGAMINGLAQTADQYSNLVARVKLVTKSQEEFQSAMRGVEQVAQETNAALQPTAELFTRIYQAGGQSQASALALTQTINQAMQVSGASAQASEAAVTQLIQALQSGVLRGEEFNSIMEQAPRLARAIADGLDVPMGKLREMAEAGQLTSDAVMSAVMSQANTVSTEYEKLPLTIGRSLTNLSNQWTVFVGEQDEAMGASAKVADAIQLVANNLDTLAGGLMASGKAWLAWKAYNFAAEFLGLRAAVVATTQAKAEDTAETVRNTAAVRDNTRAVTENKDATRRVGVDSKKGARSVDGLASSLGNLGFAFRTLRGLSLAGLVVNLPDIGKWIGETAAKMTGADAALEKYERDLRVQEAVARDTAKQNAELALKIKMAEEAALGMTGASRSLVAEFEKTKKAGKSAEDAVDALSKALDLKDITGIQNAGIAIDALSVKGQIGADQVKAAWSGALKNQDLQIFLTNATLAFDGTENGARRMAAATEAAVAEALRRTGKDMSELTTGVSAAARSAMNDVDTLIENMDGLRKSGVDVGAAISASLEKALAAADTEAAIEEVKERYRQLGEQGQLAGEMLKNGMEKAAEKLDSLKAGVNSVTEAYKQLGMKSPQELQKAAIEAEKAFGLIRESGTASAMQIREAFQRYAEAAIAANGGVANDALRAKAAMYGLKIEADQAGKSVVGINSAPLQKVASDADRAAESLRGAREASDGLNQSLGNKPGPQRAPGNSLSGSGPQPDGLTLEQMKDAGWSMREIEDYQLNKPDQQVPGQVTRQSFGFNTDNESIARANGLRGEDAKRFASVFGDLLADEEAQMRARLSAFSNVSTQTYNLEYENAFKTAVAKAKSASRQQAETQAPARVEEKRYTVEIKQGGQSNKIHVANQESADALLKALEFAAGSAT